MEGDHSIEVCESITERTLHAVFKALYSQEVMLEGIILKQSMVLPGLHSKYRVGSQEIAARTVATLRRCVPTAVPGILFLSGGQTEEDATKNLNAMNSISGSHPWKLSYSYGRALQASALKVWGGKVENSKAAQDALLARARLNSKACAGTFNE
jgi:fructose-bisphosphate aldolase class I